MLSILLPSALAAVAAWGFAQYIWVETVHTLSFDLTVTRDAPIPAAYNGKWRPQVHFTPPLGFMNDPNGCFRDAAGTWHLYYQYTPTAIVAGNEHWGHATSRDLYTWEHQKIAIFASEGAQIYSGSIVIDVNNTSGFFPNQDNGVVAIYTLNTVHEQRQELAISYDNGYTFEHYSDNPVLTVNSSQFRDPKVIRYQDHWVMVVAHSQDLVIEFLTSRDLKTWSHASNFTKMGLLGLQYECPNLVAMPAAEMGERRYVLVVSINPGAPLGGSTTQYWPGSFNGTHFEPVDGAARIVDFGKDSYAGQFFYGQEDHEDPLFIAWSSNWQYAQHVPTGEKEGWRSTMGVPRSLKLAKATRTAWNILSVPYDLTPLLDTYLGKRANMENDSIVVNYASLGSGAVYFQCNVTNVPDGALSQGSLNFTFSSSITAESVSGGIFLERDYLFWMSRQKVRDFGERNPFFTDKFSVSNPIIDGSFMLEGIIDRSILEVFLDGGRNSGTMTFYPEGELDTVEIKSSGLSAGVVVSVEISGLKSTWAPQMARDGIVYGNVTAKNASQSVTAS